ncbi:radical SAM family heme chaperone HemW [Aristophania vespae]|uniref:radical SAM family heme chaperone HemW n=1 Tax=Aristophania vespae TaxID=2697033 RepID=UPI0023514CD5|nr:radical SAM family heme chaperone HemW [Aristophania vespae]UMM64403.1 Heme chaperone HemW [Aristophania vespae]
MSQSLALYIHWPFCLAKCPYCDFNSHVREKIDQKRFAHALLRELTQEAERLNKDGKRVLGSIFFGGGTPSLMEPQTVASLIDTARQVFSFENDQLEITLEANPTSVEIEKFKEFRQAGINRVSLGIQSLREEALQALGRQHSVKQAREALELARKLFPRISFDLIYARPHQTLTDWRSELREALDMAADHLSLYQLTIEPGTNYEALYRQGKITLPSDELASDLYKLTEEEAASFGLYAYEVSNYAKIGSESRHNLAYWHYKNYLGIGPGAHSRLTLNHQHYATRRHRAPEPWAALVEQKGTGTKEELLLSIQDQAREALLMGLRLKEGISVSRFEQQIGKKLTDCLDASILQACLEENYLIFDQKHLRTTAEGRLRLELILARLVL